VWVVAGAETRPAIVAHAALHLRHAIGRCFPTCQSAPAPAPTANQVLPGLLASGSLGAADLARCAATCSALARIVTRDASSDALLWEPVCRARWATKAYDPLLLYAEELESLSHRERYLRAERDGARTALFYIPRGGRRAEPATAARDSP
jgi:hypothetical protein